MQFLGATQLRQHLSRNSLTSSSFYREQARIFDASNACADDVVKAGKNALVAIYGGRQGESLDVLRHRRYQEKVYMRVRQVEPQNLPPTSGAAK